MSKLSQNLSNDYLIVGPLTAGLTQDELDTFEFPLYEAKRVYAEPDIFVADWYFGYSGNKLSILSGSGVEVGDKYSVNDYPLYDLNSTDSDVTHNPVLTVVSVETKTLDNELVEVNYQLDEVKAGWRIIKANGDELEFPCTVLFDGGRTNNIIVDNSDSLHPNTTYQLSGLVEGPTFLIEKKEPIKQVLNVVEFDNQFDFWMGEGTSNIYKLLTEDYEERDSMLVYSINQGVVWDDISLGTSASKNYDNAFNLIVYYKGVLVETHEVTLVHQLDGYQRQMYVEEKVNKKSAYINVKVNPANLDENGVPKLPLFTNYSLWVRNPTDLFPETTYTLVESLIKGHREAKLNSIPNNINLGSRIKFQMDNRQVSKEYKVINKSGTSIYLDRPIEEDLIDAEWTDSSTGDSGDTFVLRFDETLNDSENNIYDGIEYYEIQKLDRVFYNYKNGSPFTISGVLGTLISAGVNKLQGGSIGSPVTIADMINASKMLMNSETHPIRMMMDGGITVPAYAQALKEVVEAQGLCHGFLSNSYDAEDSNRYMDETIAYKNSLNINDSNMSLFAGWIQIFDEYNQTNVWVSPEGFAAAAQSFTTRNFNFWTPAAGWERGRITGLDVRQKFTEGERDILIDNQINPIRYKEGSGLVIWGNETLLTKPSPLQLRSVSMLLIAIKEGLTSLLDYKNFDLNSERTWGIVEGSIDGFMRDEIQAKEGVYNYSLALQEIITNQDIDNRRMPVYLGIQPTMDIQEIPVTIGIYNKSIEISTSL